jgi:RNA recognition motif-containing protein
MICASVYFGATTWSNDCVLCGVRTERQRVSFRLTRSVSVVFAKAPHQSVFSHSCLHVLYITIMSKDGNLTNLDEFLSKPEPSDKVKTSNWGDEPEEESNPPSDSVPVAVSNSTSSSSSTKKAWGNVPQPSKPSANDQEFPALGTNPPPKSERSTPPSSQPSYPRRDEDSGYRRQPPARRDYTKTSAMPPRSAESNEENGGGRYSRGGPYRSYGANTRQYRDRDTYNGDRGTDRDHEDRLQSVELPTQPPYTAYVGNLPFQCNEDDVRAKFEQTGCRVKQVRIVTKFGRPKGFCYIDFEDLDSLKKALTLDHQFLLDRRLKVDVATERKRDHDESRPQGRSPPKERKKLELKPRSVPVSDGATAAEPPKPQLSKPRENPFGNATPNFEKQKLREEEVTQKYGLTPQYKSDNSPARRGEGSFRGRDTYHRDREPFGRGRGSYRDSHPTRDERRDSERETQKETQRERQSSNNRPSTTTQQPPPRKQEEGNMENRFAALGVADETDEQQ